MRVLSVLLVIVALACVGLTPARADEAVERIEQRVEMLLDLVAQLRSEVAELRKRVAVLEAELAEGRLAGTQSAPVEEAVEEVDEEAAAEPELVGVYVLDREGTVEANLDPDQEDVEKRRQEALEELKSVEMDLSIEEGGTFTAKVSGMEEDAHEASGTWTREGKTLTLVTTHEDGVEQKEDKKEEIRGVWEDGRLRLHDPEDDFTLVFQRK